MSFEKLFVSLADLPVAAIADDVVESVLSDVVTLLSSATGSGKTLYASSKLAQIYEDQGTTIVLVPRRFLAQNAAETICQILDIEVGGLVGYAVGSQSGDRSFWNPMETKLLFATYGYAIASGMVHREKLFVLDEVHETTMDLSIVRALLLRRITQGESIKVLEMSATFDPARQAAYWNKVSETKVFEIDGKTFPCEYRYRPAGNPVLEAIQLVREGRKGILVFRPGLGDVEETAEEIELLAAREGLAVDVSKIYGEMDFKERSASTRPSSDGRAKILVGTNVMESGVNFPWADGGVSCGKGKENNVRPTTGAVYLELIDLPQWRLDQQEGRVKRFQPGVFVLCSHTSREERPKATKPEIERLALTELVLHCASFGVRTHDLIFDYAPDADKVKEAELNLQRLGLIHSDCKLTKAGEYIVNLPVGPETGAMIWHSMQVGCLPQMLALAPILEVGDVRKNFKQGHYLDRTSDHFDGLMAVGLALGAESSRKKEVMERNNISYKRFTAVCEMGRVIEDKLKCEASFVFEPVRDKLRQCILAGSLNKLFVGSFLRDQVDSVKNRSQSYSIGQGACRSYSDPGALIAGNLRTITPRDKFKSPFTVLERITVGTVDDIKAMAKIRPEILIEERETRHRTYVTLKLFGEFVLSSRIDYGEEDSLPFKSQEQIVRELTGG